MRRRQISAQRSNEANAARLAVCDREFTPGIVLTETQIKEARFVGEPLEFAPVVLPDSGVMEPAAVTGSPPLPADLTWHFEPQPPAPVVTEQDVMQYQRTRHKPKRGRR
jgi:hypothetical protein